MLPFLGYKNQVTGGCPACLGGRVLWVYVNIRQLWAVELKSSHTPIQYLGPSWPKPWPPTSLLESLLDVLILLTSVLWAIWNLSISWNTTSLTTDTAEHPQTWRVPSGMHWSKASFPHLVSVFSEYSSTKTTSMVIWLFRALRGR